MWTLLIASTQKLRKAVQMLLPKPTADEAAPARTLMEHAGARAGLSPRQAHELRSAAQAYLRVVR